MKNQRIIMVITVISILVLTSLIGCSSDLSGSSSENSENVSTEFPMKVTDATGTEVTIAAKPVKIVSLTLGTDEILLEIAVKENIAAISYLSEDAGLSNIIEESKGIPVKLTLDPEKVIELQPDIVFVADWTDIKFIQQLRDANIVVYTFLTPNSIDEQEKMIKEIGRLVGEYENAVILVETMEEKLKFIEEKLSSLNETDKLTALSCDSFFFAYGTGTMFDDIAAHAGLINISAKAGITKWQQISKEKIIEMDPDVIFLPAWSYEGFDANEFAEDFKNDESLKSVKAIKNNAVFMLPEAHMTAISQNIILGVEDVAKAVYPDLFD